MLPTADPDFCVLIPVYNNAEGLLRSLRSVQYDKKKHLVVVVDDGSREPVTTELLEAASLPSPIHLIRLAQNKGITEALNTGLHWIRQHTRARYIARLDCSDTCHPERFLRQVAFLDAHPEVGLLGTWCTFSSEDGTMSYSYTTPLEHAAIEKAMYLRNVFIHPTVMFRTQLLNKVGDYPYEFLHAEDYAFFWKMIKVSKSAILDRYLVTCAISASGLSMGNRKAQLKSRLKVVRHFGNSPIYVILGFFKIKLLLVVPKWLILQWKTKQV